MSPYLCGHYLPGIGWCPNDAAKGRLMCADHARITYLTEDDGPDEDRKIPVGNVGVPLACGITTGI